MDKQKYEKGGSAGSKGSQFQVHLMTVFLLNALRMRLPNWRLSTEDKRAGKFDDVVLEWPEGAFLLQAKHKENKKRITVEQLMSTTSKNDDFSIPKYFISYQEIKDTFPLMRKAVICTNASVNERALKFLNSHTDSSESILFCEGDRVSFYTLTDEILSELKDKIKSYHCQNRRGKEFDESVISDKNLKDFQNHFQIYFEYPSGSGLEEVVEKLLNRTNWGAKASASEIYLKVMNWFQQKHGKCLTGLHVRAMVSEIKRDKYWRSLKQYDVHFPDCDLSFENSNRKYHFVADPACLLQEIRIWHALRSIAKLVIYIHPDDTMEDQRQLIEVFGLPNYIILIIVQPSESIVLELWGQIEEILNNYQDKKVVLLTERDNKLVRLIKSVCDGFDVIIEPPRFKDLLEGKRDKLLKTENILFQGTPICMDDLFYPECVEDYRPFLDSEILERLITDDHIRVGSELRVLDQEVERSYIPRNFVRKDEERCEENIFDAKDKLILIADSAGTGKTTTLTKLAVLIKNKFPHLWTFKIVLDHYSKFLRTSLENHKKTIDIRELLNYQEATKLTNKLEGVVFSVNSKVVLMLDGIDEISPSYTELVEGLLVNCLEAPNIIKIFATTRPHLSQRLEEKFSVKSFLLKSLSEKSQINFLSQYWIQNLGDTNTEKCVHYAKALVRKMSSWTDPYSGKKDAFIAIPLQVNMVAEIFQEIEQNEDVEEWEGCREFLNVDRLEPKLPEKKHLTKLYQLFIDKKRNVFLNKLNPNASAGTEQALVNLFEGGIVFHRALALDVIFDDEKIRDLFSSRKEGTSSWKPSALNMGIIQEIDNTSYFVHRTFGEYFIADCLLTEILNGNRNVEFQKFLIDEILQNREFSVINTFFDGFLHEYVDSLPHDIFQNYQCLTYYIGPSDFSYARLVHDLAEGGWVATLQLILKCVNFKIIKDKETSINKLYQEIGSKCLGNRLHILQLLVQRGGINITDDIGKTPLHMAARGGHLEMVTFLLEQGANINSTSTDQFTPLCEAATRDHLVIVKFLTEQGADILGNVRQGGSELYKTISRKHVRVVYYLLYKIVEGGNLKCGLDAEYSMIPFAAAYFGEIAILKFLIDRGMDVDRKIKNQQSLIFGAAMGGQLQAVEYLVGQGANIWTKDYEYNTVLHSISNDSSLIYIAKYFVDLGIDINSRNDYEKTALHVAAAAGAYDMAKFLIENGANVEIVEEYVNDTVIHIAASNNNLAIVELLVEHGADINFVDNFGNTFLHDFTWSGRLDVIECLVKLGADVTAKDIEGYTALRIAIIECKLDIVKFLAERISDINSRGHYGQSELHFTVSMVGWWLTDDVVLYTKYSNIRNLDNQTAFHCLAPERLNMCMLLVECGANINLRNTRGQTVLYLAILSVTLYCNLPSCEQCLLVVKYLIGLGASIGSESSKEHMKDRLAKEIKEHVRYSGQSLDTILRLPVFGLLDSTNRESDISSTSVYVDESSDVATKTQHLEKATKDEIEEEAILRLLALRSDPLLCLNSQRPIPSTSAWVAQTSEVADNTPVLENSSEEEGEEEVISQLLSLPLHPTLSSNSDNAIQSTSVYVAAESDVTTNKLLLEKTAEKEIEEEAILRLLALRSDPTSSLNSQSPIPSTSAWVAQTSEVAGSTPVLENSSEEEGEEEVISQLLSLPLHPTLSSNSDSAIQSTSVYVAAASDVTTNRLLLEKAAENEIEEEAILRLLALRSDPMSSLNSQSPIPSTSAWVAQTSEVAGNTPVLENSSEEEGEEEVISRLLSLRFHPTLSSNSDSATPSNSVYVAETSDVATNTQLLEKTAEDEREEEAILRLLALKLPKRISFLNSQSPTLSTSAWIAQSPQVALNALLRETASEDEKEEEAILPLPELLLHPMSCFNSESTTPSTSDYDYERGESLIRRASRMLGRIRRRRWKMKCFRKCFT